MCLLCNLLHIDSWSIMPLDILNANSLAVFSTLSLYINFASVRFLTKNFTFKMTKFVQVFMYQKISNIIFLFVL